MLMLLLLVLLLVYPRYWLLVIFTLPIIGNGLMVGGPNGGVAGAGFALVIGVPIVAVRKWMKARGAKKREAQQAAEVEAELARIRAEQ